MFYEMGLQVAKKKKKKGMEKFKNDPSYREEQYASIKRTNSIEFFLF